MQQRSFKRIFKLVIQLKLTLIRITANAPRQKIIFDFQKTHVATLFREATKVKNIPVPMGGMACGLQ
jgi:hypothetical protein